MSKRAIQASVTVVVLACALIMWRAWNAGPPSVTPAVVEGDSTEAALSGRVVGPDGDPISGAKVLAWQKLRQGEPTTAVTDDEGVYSFKTLEEGTWWLDAEAEGFISPGPERMRAISVEIDDEVSLEADLQLRRPAVIMGRVLRGAAPMEGISVDVTQRRCEGVGGPLDTFSLRRVAVTDGQGRFELRVAPCGTKVRVQARGLGERSSGLIELKDGARHTGLVLNFNSKGILDVRVSTLDGRKVDMSLSLTGPSYPEAKAFKIGREQRLTVDGLLPGDYLGEISARGYAALQFSVKVSAGLTTTKRLALRRSGGIRGKVVDVDGRPVPAAKVTIRWAAGEARISVDRAGEFTWSRPDVPAELVKIAAASAVHQPSDWTAGRPGEMVVLQLGPGGFLSGSVHSSDGEPVREALVQVVAVDIGGAPPAPAPLPMVMVDRKSGAFKLGPLRPGSYRIRGESQRHSSAELSDLIVEAGQNSSGHEIILGRGCRVLGDVRSISGEPIAGAVIHLVVPGSKMGPRRVRSRPDGEFSLAGVPIGRFTLRVSKRGYLTSMTSGVECDNDQQVVRTVELRRAKKGEKFAFQGIGATLAQRGTGVVIRALVPESPAAGSGLRIGDRIMAVDGRPVSEVPLQRVVEMIRGEPGTGVELSIERSGSQQVISLNRGQVVMKGRPSAPRAPPR